MPETLPQLPRVATHAVAPSAPRRPHSRLRATWRLVAVLGVLALVLAACSSDSAPAITVDGKTVSESTVNGQLAAIATNKELKAQVATKGKINPDAAATWVTQLVPIEVARQVNQKAKTKTTAADTTAAEDWATGVFGDTAWKAFPKSFQTEITKMYASIPAYVRTHTKTPTDADLQTAYDQGLAENCPSRRYVSQILVATEAEAQDVKTQLAAGTDFATLAAQKSKDTQTASSGGAYGCLERLQTAPTFADAATATPIGTVSAPVQLLDGWHVIKVQDVGEVVSFATAKPEIIDQLRTQDGKTQLAKLVAKAKIKVAARYGKWTIKDGVGTVVAPKSATTTTTTAPAGSTTTTTKP
jgi:foldase protein PrsA